MYMYFESSIDRLELQELHILFSRIAQCFLLQCRSNFAVHSIEPSMCPHLQKLLYPHIFHVSAKPTRAIIIARPRLGLIVIANDVSASSSIGRTCYRYVCTVFRKYVHMASQTEFDLLCTWKCRQICIEIWMDFIGGYCRVITVKEVHFRCKIAKQHDVSANFEATSIVNNGQVIGWPHATIL